MTVEFCTTLPGRAGEALPLHAAFTTGGVSAARAYGARYWPDGPLAKAEPRSEDVLSVFRDYSNGRAVSAAEAVRIMRVAMRDARRASVGIMGVATFAGAITFGNGDLSDLDGNGIVVGIAGDSPVFVRDRSGRTVQVSEPQEEPVRGLLINAMGGDSGDEIGRDDRVTALSIRDLHGLGLTGTDLEVIVASDGLVQQARPVAPCAPHEYAAAVAVAQAGRVAELHAGTGGALDAEALLLRALEGRSDDDIAAITFDLPTGNEHIAAFVSDGAGGHKNSVEVAEAVIQQVNDRMAQVAADFGAPGVRQLPGRPIELPGWAQIRSGGVMFAPAGDRIALPHPPLDPAAGPASGQGGRVLTSVMRVYRAATTIPPSPVPAPPPPPQVPASRQSPEPPQAAEPVWWERPPARPAEPSHAGARSPHRQARRGATGHIPITGRVRVRGSEGGSVSYAALNGLSVSAELIAQASSQGMTWFSAPLERRRVRKVIAGGLAAASRGGGAIDPGILADRALASVLTDLGFTAEARRRFQSAAGVAITGLPANPALVGSVMQAIESLTQGTESISRALRQRGRGGIR